MGACGSQIVPTPVGSTVDNTPTIEEPAIEVSVEVDGKKPGKATVNVTAGGAITVAPIQLEPSLPPGQVKGVGVLGKKRHPLLPQVPSFFEDLNPLNESLFWNVLMAPPGTPQEIVTSRQMSNWFTNACVSDFFMAEGGSKKVQSLRSARSLAERLRGLAAISASSGVIGRRVSGSASTVR